MAVLFDYLDWRGDIPFFADGANEADCYLISKIGCPDLTGIVPPDGKEISLGKAVGEYMARKGNEASSLGAAASPHIMKSFCRLPEVPRFQPLMLSGYRRVDDSESAEQFSALTIRVPDGPCFVTFRGTDDNIFAWKENFHMAIMDTIPAQEDALRYLRWAMETYDGKFIVCGHSKGGNLAIYAASMLPAAMQKRISCVYSFDGPGFQDAFLKKRGYIRILPRVHTIVPQNSLVGTLLLTGKAPEVAACGSYGIKAHYGFNWEVLGTGFVRAPGLSHSSAIFDRALDETMEGMSREEKEAFIEAFFQIMTSTGAFTLTDLTEIGLRNTLKVVRSLRRDKKVKKFALTVISNVLSDIGGRRE